MASAAGGNALDCSKLRRHQEMKSFNTMLVLSLVLAGAANAKSIDPGSKFICPVAGGTYPANELTITPTTVLLKTDQEVMELSRSSGDNAFILARGVSDVMPVFVSLSIPHEISSDEEENGFPVLVHAAKKLGKDSSGETIFEISNFIMTCHKK